MLIDLHTHTRRHSWDSLLDPNDLIERSRAAGLDGICLSEHDFFWDLDEVYGLARKHNYLVLPAVEINTEDGHILCYGLSQYVYGMHRAHELAEHIQRAGGAMVGAHPYRRQMPEGTRSQEEYEAGLRKAVNNPAYKYCDALERLNGRGNERQNRFSGEVCEMLGMPGTGGSDAHMVSDIGSCATEFFRRIETVEDLVAELKAGRFRAARLVEQPLQVTQTQAR